MTKYLDLKLEEIHKLLVDGEITPTDLVMECLDRIEENKDLNAFVTVCKDSALKRAKEIEGMDKSSLLYGIPIAIKDNIITRLWRGFPEPLIPRSQSANKPKTDER